MYSRGAGVLGTIATVGWTVQGVGNAFYFRQAHNTEGHSMEKVRKAVLAVEVAVDWVYFAGENRVSITWSKGLFHSRLGLICFPSCSRSTITSYWGACSPIVRIG
jgi:hypothetical protein